MDTYQQTVFRAIEKAMVYQGVEPDGPLIEHLFQNVFNVLMENDCQKLRQFRWKCELSNWLHLLGIRLTIDHVRRQPPIESSRRDETKSKAMPSNQTPRPLPSDEVDLRQEEWLCYKELRSILTAREQVFLKWFYELDLPLEEVSVLLGISINDGIKLKQQVREKMKRCIKRLI